jgi:hypothetical protein
MSPDSFENDNSRDSAKTAVSGISQAHNITLNDTDWVKFSADSGSLYVIKDNGVASFYTNLYLYYESETSPTTYTYNYSSGTLSWSWNCLKSGTYYLRVTPYYTGYTGAYSLAVTKYNPATAVTFTSPTSVSTIPSGISSTITWVPDSSILGNYVYLYLYKGNQLVTYISSSYSSNNGTYSWIPSTALASGSDYQIKIVNYNNSNLYGFSQNFTISGIAPDAYEPDAPRTLASIATLGTAQSHNLTYNDTDWVKFPADSGAKYIIQTNGMALYTYLFYNTDAGYTDYDYSTTATSMYWIWTCAKTGTYNTRIYSYGGSYSGSYTFKVTKYDSSTAITFTSPTATTTMAAGTANTISWVPDSTLLGNYVYLYLYKGNQLVTYISSSYSSNNGTYSWIPSTALSSGSDYQIKIVNYNNSYLYGFSQNFTISGATPDSYEPDAPRTLASIATLGTAQSHNLTYNDTDWVKFPADSGSKYVLSTNGLSLYHYLYYGTDASPTTTNYSSSTALSWVWTCIKTGTYSSKLFSYNGGSYTGAYTFKVTKYDSLSAITFTSPTATSTIAAGATTTISWMPDTTILSYYVYLYLYKGNQQVTYINSSYSSNGGTYSWTFPTGLVSGSDYRIKIVNYNNSTMYAYSPAFTVSGALPDAYEPDAPRTLASTATLGTAQSHTLTYNDTDWVKFAADSGSKYVLSTNGLSLDHYLYYGTDASPTITNYSSSTALSWVWSCIKTGTYSSKLFSYNGGSYTGAYTYKVTKFDSLTSITFGNPTTSSAFTGGSSYSITWTPDTSLLGTNVYLYLFKGSQLIQTIGSYVANSGTYTWTPPTTLATGVDYRIRIVNYSNTSVFGLSPVFSISATWPDAYEPDAPRSLASSLTLGTAQSHSLTYNDTDWIKFSADSGSKYLIQDSGLASYVYLYYGSDVSSTTYNYSSSTSLFWLWSCTKTGTYSTRVNAYNGAAYTGPYSFKVSAYDSTKAVVFTTPTSASNWSTGTAYSVTWVPDLNLQGNYVSIYLYKGTTLTSLYYTYVSNTSTYTITVPNGYASGNDYRIKIANYNNSLIYGFSQPFSITGVAADAYEPDNQVSLAHAIATTGTAENHTLPMNDTDFCSFTATTNNLYVLSTTGTIRSSISLYSTDKTTLLASANTAYTDSNATVAWLCPTAGTYYFRTTASLGGSYKIAAKAYDSTGYKMAISKPAATDSLTIGGTFNIQWSSLNIGGTVNLFLYQNGTIIGTMATTVPNTGSYSWLVPTTTAAGTNYSIKVVSSVNAVIYGNSAGFTIK